MPKAASVEDKQRGKGRVRKRGRRAAAPGATCAKHRKSIMMVLWMVVIIIMHLYLPLKYSDGAVDGGHCYYEPLPRDHM